MIDHPFSIFDDFADELSIGLFTKQDNIQNDGELRGKLRASRSASLEQTHGNTAIIAREAIARSEKGDGLMTDMPDLILSVRTADCQQFVVFDPKKHAFGVIHAGWKGLVRGIIPAFFEKFFEEWNSDARNLIVGAGPSLCKNCAEFTDPKQELIGIDKKFFDGRHADLRAIADDQLLSMGISFAHMERSPDCTKCNPDVYWTYRGGDKDAVNKRSVNYLACVMRSE